MIRPTALSALLLATTALTAPTTAQRNWVNRQLDTSPPLFVATHMAWIPSAQRIWWVGQGASFTAVEVWEYDGMTWAQVPDGGTAPPGLAGAAFDTSRDVLVGVGSDFSVWEFDGTAWTPQISPPTVPAPARSGWSMVYDAGRGEILLGGGEYYDSTFGGYTNANDLWAWDGTDWTQRHAGPGGGNAGNRMAYDPIRQVVVIHGGNYSVEYLFTGQQTFFVVGTTYEWDGATMRLAMGGSKRAGHSMAWDPIREAVVAFGGFATCGYACKYEVESVGITTGGAWTYDQNVPLLDRYSGTLMAFDERRQRLVLVGGTARDTWEFFDTDQAQFATYGRGCPGAGGTPNLDLPAGVLPTLGAAYDIRVHDLPGAPAAEAMFLDLAANAPAPIDLDVLGFAGCQLLVQPTVTTPLVSTAGTAVWSVAIPSDPIFAGLTFRNQAIAADPSPMLTLSNGATSTVQAP